MLPRLLIAAALLALAGCASADERAATVAAQKTCRATFPTEEAQYEACVTQLEANIQDARNYHSEPARPQRGGQRH